ncbi:MAG: hypothetical protein HAW58_04320 [Candidatus Thioglobus sp.]|nr:hypothetical protein [Candidatus Thioglobus sp.]
MKTKIIILTAFLATNVLAGGDDRDRGPVESLDRFAPAADQIVPGNRNAHKMQLSEGEEIIGHTKNGVAVTAAAHEVCKNKLALSVANIARFKALLDGNLYNTGPLDSFGTEFSHERWDEYFACVENQ